MFNSEHPDVYAVAQPANLRVSAGELAGQRHKAIASLQVPHGAYVVVAKFTVAVGAGADNDLQPRISQFNLTFGGKTDLSWCHLNQGGLDTVMLTIAGNVSVAAVASGAGSLRQPKAILSCLSTNHDLEIKDLVLTALEVDSVTAN